MIKKKRRSFRFNWISIDQLAIGNAPKKQEDLQKLKEKGIKNILSLCSKEEEPFLKEIENSFNHVMVVLPDHKTGKIIKLEELQFALYELNRLLKISPVFIHCVAAMERSPLVCLAWLVKVKNLELQSALGYMMQVHPGTNPLIEQLEVINKL